MCRPRGFPSTTPRILPTWRSCGRHCASRFQDCSRAPAISHSSPRSPAHGLDTSILDGDYWFANLRQPVLFEQAVRWSYEHGYRTFIESSPHPVLTVGIQESLEDYHRRPQRGWDASTQRRRHAPVPAVGCRSPRTREVATTGRACSTTPARCRVDLPTYAFQRKRYWMDTRAWIRRREQSRRRRRGASAARCGCGTSRFRRNHSHRPVVARISSVAGRPQSARGRARTGCGDGGAGATRGRPCGDARGWTNSCCRPQ